MGMRLRAFAFLSAATLAATPLRAELAVSANDGHTVLTDAGAQVPATPPVPDSVTVLDLSASPPRIVGEVQAPASVVGPPQSVAVAPNETFAIVTSATRVDPNDAARIVPDDRVTVIDLTSTPPRVRASLTAGKGAAGVSINREGTLALVANRTEGTLSVFKIAGGEVSPAGKVDLGNDKAGPSHVVFSRDGREAYVTRDGDNKVSVLAVEGSRVTYAKRDFTAGVRPYGIEITPSGDVALVANVGQSSGDHDTVSVIDLRAKPARVVNTVTVGPTPEGIRLSADGRHAALVIENGSNLAKASPFFNDKGVLRIYAVSGTDLRKVAEAPIGRWCQGAVWTRDGRTVLVQCMVDRRIEVFRFDGEALSAQAPVALGAGGAGFRTAEP
ncbi:YncE family protein [Methylobacterium sp. WSM2598]|uniref:YncE family protein n=1 Tax=Methylobacterium sp. WSM2598 TaxID=398261 RepID=UPI00037AF139|nr:YncE family protein [Methylobacterium sp. WSM2598]